MKISNILRTLACLVATTLIISCTQMKTTENPEASLDSVKIKTENAVDVKTSYAEVNGRKIAYRSLGKGAPLILCNRYRGNLDTWDPAFLDALAKEFNVITFDYSGFGLSTGSPATDMKTFAMDVTDLSKALGLSKFILGGWSFGGAVAQVFIAEYPELVTHGVLIGTGPPGKNDVPVEPIFYERASILHNSLDDEIVLFFEPAWEPSREAAKRSHDRISRRMADVDVLIPETLWGNYHLGFKDYIEDKNGIREKILTSKVPMILIMGDHDISFPINNWYVLARKIQSIQLIVIPMSGHGPQHEFPEMTAGYIRIFCKHL